MWKQKTIIREGYHFELFLWIDLLAKLAFRRRG